ncbi:hypothetical protein Tco_0066704 [Tanacetum coccineum]
MRKNTIFATNLVLVVWRYAQRKELISKKSFVPVARLESCTAVHWKKCYVNQQMGIVDPYLSDKVYVQEKLYMVSNSTKQCGMMKRSKFLLADLFTKALSEDKFKYLVRRLGMRCLTLDELEVLTKIELTLEQSQQGVSNDVLHDHRSLSSFITMAKGGSSLIFTLFSLPAGAELTFEAGELLLPLAGAEDGSFILTPFKVSTLNVDFDLKIDLIVFGPEISSAPSNFFNGGRGVLQTEDSSSES